MDEEALNTSLCPDFHIPILEVAIVQHMRDEINFARSNEVSYTSVWGTW